MNKFNLLVKKIFRFFLQGLLLAAPSGITIFVIYWVFEKIDGPVRNYVNQIFQYPDTGHRPGGNLYRYRPAGLGRSVIFVQTDRYIRGQDF